MIEVRNKKNPSTNSKCLPDVQRRLLLCHSFQSKEDNKQELDNVY